jgi:hypothetical protein
VAEARFAALGGREGGDDFPLGLGDRAENHLGDTHARFDKEGLLTEVDEEDLDFAAVVGIDGAGGVEEGDAVMEGQTAAGADLGLPAKGNLQIKAGRDEEPFARLKGVRRRQVGVKV